MVTLPLRAAPSKHSDQPRITIVSWNVLNKNSGPDIVGHLSGLAAAAAGIDIYCLQEVPVKKSGSDKPVPELIGSSFDVPGTAAITHKFYHHIGPVID